MQAILSPTRIDILEQQAGAELCQAQQSLG